MSKFEFKSGAHAMPDSFALSDAVFWEPDRLAPSAWTAHVPFAFWLVDTLRPRNVVELGTHNGVSYCAFCQAVARLGLSSQCFAVDTWQGDPQAGFYGEEVYAELKEYHDEKYGLFSTLLRMTFDHARPFFADGTIDLLHIDGYHSYEAVRHDFELWKPALSSDGVILFHDIDEMREGFGVYQLWEELAAKHPSFAFKHGHGLGVISFSSAGPLLELLSAGASDIERKRVESAFERLGRGCVDAFAAHKLRIDNRAIKTVAEEARRETQHAQELGVELKHQVEQATATVAIYEGELREWEERCRQVVIDNKAIKAVAEKARREAQHAQKLEVELKRQVEKATATVAIYDGKLREWEERCREVAEASSQQASLLLDRLRIAAQQNADQLSRATLLSKQLIVAKRQWRDGIPRHRPELASLRGFLRLTQGNSLPSLVNKVRRHYRLLVQRRQIATSGLFDPTYYLATQPDVANAGIDALTHFCRFGWREGRQPSEHFDITAYLRANPDVAEAGVNPLFHYAKIGRFEHRPIGKNQPARGEFPDSRKTALNGKRRPLHRRIARFAAGSGHLARLIDAGRQRRRYMQDRLLIAKSGFFDVQYYLKANKDVADAEADPLRHFCLYGWRENRQPSAKFDIAEYIRANPDVAVASINPLVHYLRHGRDEGRPIARPVESPALKRMPSGSRISGDTPTIKTPRHAAPPETTSWDHIPLLVKLRNLSNPILDAPPTLIVEEAISAVRQKPLRISVIIPTWNRERTICDAIASALGQTLLPYEIIVSDDGSTDGTIAAIENRYSVELTSGRLKLLKNSHAGVSAARNAALAVAEGDLFAYLDSDNKWRPNYLLLMTALFSQCDELGSAYCALKGHNLDINQEFVRANRYDRRRLLNGNFIDMNVFMHRRGVYEQLGGFDTELRRLVDWELIIRFTKLYPPAYLPVIGVDYFIEQRLENITNTVTLDDNKSSVQRKHFAERVRFGLEPLRLAYFLYDFPALTQTFVMSELRWLVANGFDIKVYYAIDPDRKATLDFHIDSFRVRDAEHFAELLVQHDRNYCHGHFVYPGVTLYLWPVCEKLKIPFTFMPHAVDLFHNSNRKRHRVGEIVRSKYCTRAFVHGEHHMDYLVECGAPAEKITFNFQAVDLSDFAAVAPVPSQEATGTPGHRASPTRRCRGIFVGRFIEKKGVENLIRAAALIKDRRAFEIHIYGYGPLESHYRELIVQHGLAGVVEVCGPLLDHAAVVGAYAEADFVIAPSVIAKNGDIDGFPTVILEAMAARRIVLTTALSAIPDYLTDNVEAVVVPPDNVEALALGLERVLTMTPERREAMNARSAQLLSRRVGVVRTMTKYLDHWQSASLDIILVTYNKPGADNRSETLEIIRRIRRYTTTPYFLTIVDNDSDADFWTSICHELQGADNIRLLRLGRNVFCAPATNIGVRMGDSKYVVYICSKEGFIARHGWERVLIDYMDDKPDIEMAGHLCHLPRSVYGRELPKLDYFQRFRNQEFAFEHSAKAFTHVQGGAYILRRSAFDRVGGFNDEIPQNGMDVEFSYYLESEGNRIGKIPELVSLSNKTLPRLTAQLTERTVLAHPLDCNSVTSDLDVLARTPRILRCNLCGWSGSSFVSSRQAENGHAFADNCCPECGSSGLDRLVYAALASDHRAHRGLNCAGLVVGEQLMRRLGTRMFRLSKVSGNRAAFVQWLQTAKGTIGCLIVDTQLLPVDHGEPASQDFWRSALAALCDDGLLVFTDRTFAEPAAGVRQLGALSHTPWLRSAGAEARGKFTIEYWDQTSDRLGFDWCRLGCVVKQAQGEAVSIAETGPFAERAATG